MGRNVGTYLIALSLLASTLACAALTKIILPDDTSEPPPGPTIESPTIISPTAPPVEASCPGTLAEIMDAATANDTSAGASDIGQDEEMYLVTYEVTGDQIGNPFLEDVPSNLKDEQEDTAAHEDVWTYFASLIPPERRREVAEYSIMTDGRDGILAAVAQTTYDPKLWAVEVDIADIEDRANLTFTLVHEFGHLLTLGSEQVPPSLAVFSNPDDNDIYLQEVSACPNYFPGEGCSKADSYINAFFNEFWADIHAEWQAINLIEDDDAYYEELDNFYSAHQDQFVTDYAATSPEEDIAESWSFFVLGPRPEGGTIAEEKVLFFYDYPELVQLRGEILGNLCTIYP